MYFIVKELNKYYTTLRKTRITRNKIYRSYFLSYDDAFKVWKEELNEDKNWNILKDHDYKTRN